MSKKPWLALFLCTLSIRGDSENSVVPQKISVMTDKVQRQDRADTLIYPALIKPYRVVPPVPAEIGGIPQA